MNQLEQISVISKKGRSSLEKNFYTHQKEKKNNILSGIFCEKMSDISPYKDQSHIYIGTQQNEQIHFSVNQENKSEISSPYKKYGQKKQQNLQQAKIRQSSNQDKLQKEHTKKHFTIQRQNGVNKCDQISTDNISNINVNKNNKKYNIQRKSESDLIRQNDQIKFKEQKQLIDQNKRQIQHYNNPNSKLYSLNFIYIDLDGPNVQQTNQNMENETGQIIPINSKINNKIIQNGNNKRKSSINFQYEQQFLENGKNGRNQNGFFQNNDNLKNMQKFKKKILETEQQRYKSVCQSRLEYFKNDKNSCEISNFDDNINVQTEYKDGDKNKNNRISGSNQNISKLTQKQLQSNNFLNKENIKNKKQEEINQDKDNSFLIRESPCYYFGNLMEDLQKQDKNHITNKQYQNEANSLKTKISDNEKQNQYSILVNGAHEKQNKILKNNNDIKSVKLNKQQKKSVDFQINTVENNEQQQQYDDIYRTYNISPRKKEKQINKVINEQENLLCQNISQDSNKSYTQLNKLEENKQHKCFQIKLQNQQRNIKFCGQTQFYQKQIPGELQVQRQIQTENNCDEGRNFSSDESTVIIRQKKKSENIIDCSEITQKNWNDNVYNLGLNKKVTPIIQTKQVQNEKLLKNFKISKNQKFSGIGQNFCNKNQQNSGNKNQNQQEKEKENNQQQNIETQKNKVQQLKYKKQENENENEQNSQKKIKKFGLKNLESQLDQQIQEIYMKKQLQQQKEQEQLQNKKKNGVNQMNNNKKSGKFINIKNQQEYIKNKRVFFQSQIQELSDLEFQDSVMLT